MIIDPRLRREPYLGRRVLVSRVQHQPLPSPAPRPRNGLLIVVLVFLVGVAAGIAFVLFRGLL